MIGKVANKIGKAPNGKFIRIDQDTDIVLTLTVDGTCFPSKRNISATGSVEFRSVDNVDNKVYIDYADGTGEHVYVFKASSANRRLYFRNMAGQTNPATVSGSGTYDQNPIHFYQDLPDGVKNTVDDDYPQQRTVRIRFEKPQSITYVSLSGFFAYGVFPAAVSKLRNLEVLALSTLFYLDAFAQDFYNSSIKTFTVSQSGNLLGAGFAEWMFHSPLVNINVNSSANLADDPVAKKVSRLNEVKETLVTLNISNTGLNYTLPVTFGELDKLESLNIGDNTSALLRLPVYISGLLALKVLEMYNTRMPFSEVERLMDDLPDIHTVDISNCQYNTDQDITGTNTKIKTMIIGGNNDWNNRTVPSFVSKLTALENLRMGIPSSMNTVVDRLRFYGDFSACTALKLISISQLYGFETTVPLWFSSLVNLKTFSCWGTFLTQARINEFVDNFYAFIVANASMAAGNTKFRQMTVDTYGVSSTIQAMSFRPSGTYQQPAGYVAGSSNGTPASQMEKIWILTNQYSHSWTVKP